MSEAIGSTTKEEKCETKFVENVPKKCLTMHGMASQAEVGTDINKTANATKISERSREEGEIFSEDSHTLIQDQTTADDDCIILENDIEKVTIIDDDDDIFFEDITGSPTLRCKPLTINTTLTGTLNTNDEVIILDDTPIPKPMEIIDDSIQFISETLPEYIPLASIGSQQKFQEVKVPIKKRILDDTSLFSNSEKKQLRDYNENAYNPNKTEQLESRRLNPKRLVIIDGSNVAYAHHRNNEFSVEGLKICINYFKQMGHDVKAVIPQFRLQRNKSTNSVELERMHKEGIVVLTPCKNLPGMSTASYDDRFILQLASELDAAIVSNDNYRDLINENSAFKKLIENRVIGYTWCDDFFILPKDPYGKFGPTLHSILNRAIKQ